MTSTIRSLLMAAALCVPAGTAFGDGLETDYGAAGPYDGQPEYFQNDPNQQPSQDGSPYQAPPEGVCYDDNNQAYDCSSDPDYQSYSQVDDGYDQTAYQDFQQALSPYGSWVDVPQYGQVWTPSTAVVGYDFSPYYSGGNWQLTDYGWTWVSEWDWGWAPFHYGRWTNIGSYGWCWIPGRIWGPAWVHWRHGGGYVGWTALPPRGIRVAPPVGVRAAHWNFIAAGQIGAGRMTRVAPALVPGIYARTAPANVLRSIGSTRVNIGPLPSSMQIAHVSPVPLRSFHQALPRAEVSVRAGMPLAARPYVSAARQSQTLGRPGYQSPAYQHPGYQAPAYQHPNYQTPGYQRPGYQAPAYQHPNYQAPVYQRPGYQAPAYQNPGYQAPAYQHPNYQAPTYQRPAPSYQAPAYQHPSYQAPTYQRPAPSYQAPTYQHPSYQAPVYQRPAPSYQAPAYQRPAPSYQAPVYQRPTSSYQAPVYQRPSYSAPVYHAPAYSPPVSRPSYSAPAYHSAPSYSGGSSFHSAPAGRSYSAPAARSSGGGGGGSHRR